MSKGRQLHWYPLFLDGEGDPSGPGTATVVRAPEVEPERRNDSSPGLRGDSDQGAVARTMRELRQAFSRGEVTLEGQIAAPPAAQATIEVQTDAAATAEPVPQAADPAAEAVATPPGEEGATVEEEATPLEADDALLQIELPPRRPGQEPIAIRVEDRETAEALRHMRNLAGRTTAAETTAAQVRQNQLELEAFEQILDLDPVGTLVDRLDPRRHVEAAQQLLALPGVLEAVAEQMESWQQNPDARAAAQARFENVRLKTAGTVRQQLAVQEQNRQIVEGITSTVGLLTELVDPELAGQFRDDCLGDLAAYARANPLTGPLAPEQFPALLARRIRLYGLDPAQAAGAIRPDARPSHPSSRPRPKGPAAEALAASPAAQRSTANGKQFITASRIRQGAAAALPTPGAAITVTTGERPAKGSGVKGAIAFLRQRMAQGGPR